MNFDRQSYPPQSRAFSLLELSATIAVLLILAGGIFGVTTVSFELTAEMKDYQDANLKRQRFVDLLRLNFESLPGHGSIELETIQNQGAYETYLSFYDHPAAFRFGAGGASVNRVILATSIETDGFLAARLYYLTTEESDLFSKGNKAVLARENSVLLSDRLKTLEWSLRQDKETQDTGNWDRSQGRPLVAECRYAFDGDQHTESQRFWIPSRQPVRAVSRAKIDTATEDPDPENEEPNLPTAPIPEP